MAYVSRETPFRPSQPELRHSRDLGPQLIWVRNCSTDSHMNSPKPGVRGPGSEAATATFRFPRDSRDARASSLARLAHVSRETRFHTSS